jgi:pyruvate/2-oxoglutarate dehydrogenase complex dihydrolipoamide acyltransferase (E2) component
VPDIGDFKDVPVIEVMVKPGDRVKPEDSLVSLESDKATMDVPAPVGGVVKEVKLKVGDKVSEGTLIITLVTDSAAVAVAKVAAPTPTLITPRTIMGGTRGTMDKLVLMRRYAAIFESYDDNGSREVKWLKEAIEARMLFVGSANLIPWISKEKRILRPDAALFLLTSFDQMIIRPYWQKEVTDQRGDIVHAPARQSMEKRITLLKKSIDVIFAALEANPGPEGYSSHDVLQAIDQAWPSLAILFLWA